MLKRSTIKAAAAALRAGQDPDAEPALAAALRASPSPKALRAARGVVRPDGRPPIAPERLRALLALRPAVRELLADLEQPGEEREMLALTALDLHADRTPGATIGAKLTVEQRAAVSAVVGLASMRDGSLTKTTVATATRALASHSFVKRRTNRSGGPK